MGLMPPVFTVEATLPRSASDALVDRLLSAVPGASSTHWPESGQWLVIFDVSASERDKHVEASRVLASVGVQAIRTDVHTPDD